ncbi:MAG: TIGR02266 family protein [Myxococcota bacterium]
MDVELSRAEAELQQEETALQTEASKLATVSSQLGARLSAARELVTQAVAAGVPDEGLAGRLEMTQVPPLNVAGTLGKSRAAREAALKARLEAHALAKQQLAAAKAQLTKLTQQFLADEQAAHALAARAKEARARPAAPPPALAPTLVSRPTGAPAQHQTVTARPSAITAASAAPTVTARPQAADGKAFDGKQSQRLQHRVKMQAAVDFGSDNNFFNGFSANISDGGLFVATVKHVPIGTHIDLNFSLPSGERIQAQGVVRWVREVNDKDPDSMPGIGVQFTRLDESAQAAIERFVASREPMFYVE